jgi:hypothetical protein
LVTVHDSAVSWDCAQHASKLQAHTSLCPSEMLPAERSGDDDDRTMMTRDSICRPGSRRYYSGSANHTSFTRTYIEGSPVLKVYLNEEQ